MQKDDRSGDDNQKDSVSDPHIPLSPRCPLILIWCATDVFVLVVVLMLVLMLTTAGALGQVVLEREISVSVSL